MGHFGSFVVILIILEDLKVFWPFGGFKGIFVISVILRIFSHFRGFRDIFVNFLGFKCILILLEALRIF